ncbi:MAG: PTS sugar transporter subunit IIA [Verrucomicrobia bacterium]|nr:PTS sugar transporter subunit IIA [Verrucomicrobiota bacterium]
MSTPSSSSSTECRTTLVTPRRVNLQLQATTQADAILETATLLAGHHAMTSFEKFQEDLLSREAAGPTHLGTCVALPHARTAAVMEILVAAGRSEQGIPFTGLKEPVRLIFVVATPRSAITGYLATVGALARMLRDTNRLERLLHCATPAEFAALLPAV